MSSRAPRRIVGNPAHDQRPNTDLVVLFLPAPVSVNVIWARKAGGGVRLSEAYRAWLQEAGWSLEQQRPGAIRGRYELTLRLPEESGLDLDNAIKGLSDLLQAHGVIRNDRDACRIVLEWQCERPEAVVRVAPFAARAS